MGEGITRLRLDEDGVEGVLGVDLLLLVEEGVCGGVLMYDDAGGSIRNEVKNNEASYLTLL